MKKSLFLYLFILAALFNVFTYMYFSKQVDFESQQHTKLGAKLRDSLNFVTSKMLDANYFSLDYNQNAQNYFANEEKPLDYGEIIPRVKDKLMEGNDNPEGNPYTGQEKITEQKFIINKAKVLNHRWIIADYSNGQLWGEVLLKYFPNDDGTVSFEVIQSILYQK